MNILSMRFLNSRLFFWTSFILFCVITQYTCRYRNVLDTVYFKNQGFPILIYSEKTEPSGKTKLVLSHLPLPKSIAFSLILPPQPPSPGVFVGTYIGYTVEKVSSEKMLVTLRYYSDRSYTPWDIAVYEATHDNITPIYINGGSHSASWLISALIALLFVFFLKKLIEGIVWLFKNPNPTVIVEKFRNLRGFHDPFWLPIVFFFLYYFWVLTQLIPYNTADAYAWLWRRTFNEYFLSGRCLTQRVIFALCESNLRIISVVQLLIFLLSALLLYWLFRRISLINRLLLMLFIAFVFSSYTFNLSAIQISSEPIFLALMLVFPSILFLWPQQRRDWGWAVTLSGILFIFSKNIAPFLTLVLVSLHFILVPRLKQSLIIIVFSIISGVAVLSILTTQNWDQSLHLNVVNNICKRVLTDSATVKLFQQRYGMPKGDYIEQLRGKDVNSPLDEHQRLYTVNTTTMDFELIDDQYGFMEWVKTKGRQAYLRFLFLDQPITTYNTFRTAFHSLYQSPVIRAISQDLGPKDWTKKGFSNLEFLSKDNPQQAIGFLGFDALEILKNLLVWFGFGHVELIYGYILLGLIVLRIAAYQSNLPLAITLLVISLMMFFLSFYGDAIGIERHTSPALILLTLTGILYLFSLADIVIHYYYRHSEKPRFQTFKVSKTLKVFS